jgi:hypothetical protein
MIAAGKPAKRTIGRVPSQMVVLKISMTTRVQTVAPALPVQPTLRVNALPAVVQVVPAQVMLAAAANAASVGCCTTISTATSGLTPAAVILFAGQHYPGQNQADQNTNTNGSFHDVPPLLGGNQIDRLMARPIA